jgi:hypothetical protein
MASVHEAFRWLGQKRGYRSGHLVRHGKGLTTRTMPAITAASALAMGPAFTLPLRCPIRYKRRIVFWARKNVALPTRHHGLVAASLAVWMGTVACSRNIGDACTNNIDCDPSGGTRTCDQSQPGGYCLIEGCDSRSCPEDSFCARFFPEPFLVNSDVLSSHACDPNVEGESSGCGGGEVCVPSAASGICVRLSLERRVCVQNCSGDGDCRSGYVCQPTRVNGAVPLTPNNAATPSFCKPKLPS